MLRYYKALRRVHEGMVFVLDYQEIDGVYVTGIDIHDDDIYVERTLVFLVTEPSESGDVVISNKINKIIRAIGDFHKSFLLACTWLAEDIGISELERKKEPDDELFESIQEAYQKRNGDKEP